ncbi:uncharacterized protein DSM5745_04507 [Aspergillus mulundensis]|uniref:CorA family metal ion transporter n=1 Tax=Aspergillus mulundensis TaxID=1810919 RepID=A0A3D8SDD7_9EURO|nr:Uncharacterized protein DSM5745_04507 [Aspergillus mulundensis]RDW84181.1 Uncharacterized protein DSM5745_04507 [Aspergillus mulundensis]
MATPVAPPAIQPNPHPPQTTPAEPTREWYWDFGDIRLNFPPDGVSEIVVMEQWSWHDDVSQNHTANSASRLDSYRQDQIIQRLQEPIPTHENRPPSSGFQLAIVPCSFQSLPCVGIELLDKMNEALGLINHHHHYASVRSGAIGTFQMADGSWLFARPRAPDFSSLTTILRYTPSTNTTRGVIYHDSVLPQSSNITAEFAMCPHPLLIPLIACELTLHNNVYHLERYQTTLEQMEGATGYGVLNENAEAVLDHRMLVKALSQARSGVHLALSTLRSTKSCVEFILRKIDWVDERLSPETHARLKARHASTALRERAEFVASTIEHALLRGGVKERLEGQHSTLFNLITQNDSLLSTSIAQDSREIAAASKRDSSSMKIVAFLTTFFLPATFVATFFSMPLFNWDSPSVSHVATGHFWVFWAVAAPLTVVTMVCIVAWAVWHERNTRRMERKERLGFSQVVADEAMNLKRAATMREENAGANGIGGGG